MNLDFETLFTAQPLHDNLSIDGKLYDGPDIDDKCNPVTCRLIIFFTDNLMPFFMNNIIEIESPIETGSLGKPTTSPLEAAAAASEPEPRGTAKKFGIMNRDFTPEGHRSEEMLLVKKDTKIEIVGKQDENWTIAKQDDKTGLVPTEYVTETAERGAEPGEAGELGAAELGAAGEPEEEPKKYMIVTRNYTHSGEGNAMNLIKDERIGFIKQEHSGDWIRGKRGEEYGWVHPNYVAIEPTADENNKIIIFTFTCMFNFIFYHLYRRYSENEKKWVTQQINTILYRLPNEYHALFNRCICIDFENSQVKPDTKLCNFLITITHYSNPQVKLLDEFIKVMKRCLPFWKIEDASDDRLLNQETKIDLHSSIYYINDNKKYILLQPISINTSYINYIPKKSNYMKSFIKRYVDINNLSAEIKSGKTFAEIYNTTSEEMRREPEETKEKDIKISLLHFLLFLIFLRAKYPEVNKKIKFYPETYDEYYTLFSNISQNTIDQICNICESLNRPLYISQSSLPPLRKRVYLNPPKFLLPIDSDFIIPIASNLSVINESLYPIKTKGGSLAIPINIKNSNSLHIKNAHDNVNLSQIKPSAICDLKVKKHKKTIKKKLLKNQKKTKKQYEI